MLRRHQDRRHGHPLRLSVAEAAALPAPAAGEHRERDADDGADDDAGDDGRVELAALPSVGGAAEGRVEARLLCAPHAGGVLRDGAAFTDVRPRAVAAHIRAQGNGGPHVERLRQEVIVRRVVVRDGHRSVRTVDPRRVIAGGDDADVSLGFVGNFGVSDAGSLSLRLSPSVFLSHSSLVSSSQRCAHGDGQKAIGRRARVSGVLGIHARVWR